MMPILKETAVAFVPEHTDNSENQVFEIITRLSTEEKRALLELWKDYRKNKLTCSA